LLNELAQARALGASLLIAAATSLHALAQRGQEVLVLKGLLFADSYYPEFCARPMGDLDLVSAPGQGELLQRALREAGFAREPEQHVQDHAVAYRNRAGVKCDAHLYLESFPNASWEATTRPHELRHVRGVRVRALEPDMLLAHLVLHMHGHASSLGLVLLWLLDLAFVLQRHGDELDLERVRRLIAEPGAWALLLRSARLLEKHGQALPPALKRALRLVPALSLSCVLRARRAAPWGLPGPRGWARLLAQRMTLRTYAGRESPTCFDLCALPVDLLVARAARELGRAQLHGLGERAERAENQRLC
jgi:hypothetical protein